MLFLDLQTLAPVLQLLGSCAELLFDGPNALHFLHDGLLAAHFDPS
jgi:hypothetical protein